jgi:hypothetical protein
MPRNSGGIASRVTPPGATGYIVGSDIDANVFNSEFNDIYSELSNSIDKAGRTTLTGNIPFSSFKATGLGAGTVAGDAMRFQNFASCPSTAITANGVQAIPNEGSYLNYTTASIFNVTGFNDCYLGRKVAIQFPANITLINSAALVLAQGVDRYCAGGEIFQFINTATGVWSEIGADLLIDLSSYGGLDVALNIGQSAIYTLASLVTSIPLRIACANQQEYSLSIFPTLATAVATGTATALKANNVNLDPNTFNVMRTYMSATTPGAATVASDMFNSANIVLDIGFTCRSVRATICTRTNTKTVTSTFFNASDTVNYSGTTNTTGKESLTVWSSLGTVTWANAITGRVAVKRLL